MTIVELTEVKAFLERYRAFREEHASLFVEDFKQRFRGLASGLKLALTAEKEVVRLTSPEFSLFNTLRIEGDEDKHSRFIHHLLDPTGEHGQGALFLAAFLDMLSDLPESADQRVVVPGIGTVGDWWVQRERTIPNGRPDLVLSNRRQHWILVIENKISTQDHGDQLTRYAKWLESLGQQYEHRYLAYLTPTGAPAITPPPGAYLRLSYCEDISEWLETALPAVMAPRIRGAIQEYLHLIGTF